MPKKELITTQQQISAYSWKTTHDIFIMTTEFLEKYIEVAGYYSDWESRKQIRDNRVQRKDKSLEEAEKSFSTMLFLFYSNLAERPSSISEKVKEEYYQWINNTGINVDNCPERLKYILLGLNEVLEGKGEKILEDVKNAKRDYEVGSPEYGRALNEVFADVQNPLDVEEEAKKSLEGKSWKEVEVGNKFGSGDNEQNKEIFQKIKKSVSFSSYQNDFHFFPQKERQQIFANQGRILTDKIKQNLNEWDLKEVVVFKGHYGNIGERRESALVHKSANLKKFDWQGNLEIDPRMIYFEKDHQPEEWVQIDRYYTNKSGISSSLLGTSSPQQSSSSAAGVPLGSPPSPPDGPNEIIQDVKNNPNNWRLDKVSTEMGIFGEVKKWEWLLIHVNAREDDFNQDEKLNFINNPLYRWESFNAYQRFEIKQALEISGDYSTEEEISWVVEEVKDNPGIWRIGTFKGQTCLIHSLAQGNDNEIGTLIHYKQKFNDLEWKKINKALIIKDISQWGFRNVAVFNGIFNDGTKLTKYDNERQETVFIKKSVQLGPNDYDNLGNLLPQLGRLYREPDFNKEQWDEIKKALNNNEIIEKVNQSDWIIATINLAHGDSYEAVVNKSAIEGQSLKVGGELYNKSQFTDEEWEEIENACYGSRDQQQMQENRLPVFSLSSSKHQPNQNNSGNTGLIITLVMIGALLVGSVVAVVRKKLNKKKIG